MKISEALAQLRPLDDTYLESGLATIDRQALQTLVRALDQAHVVYAIHDSGDYPDGDSFIYSEEGPAQEDLQDGQEISMVYLAFDDEG